MKLLLVTAEMCGGGTERVIAVLANYMVRHGHDVTILMTAGDKVVYELDRTVKVISAGGRTGGSVRKRLERIKKIREYYKADRQQIIVSFGTETNLFALFAGLFLPNRIIVSERNDPNKCGYPQIRNMLYRLADGLVFQTKEAAECFSEAIVKKSRVIPNPVKEHLPEPFAGERTREMVAVGRLEPQKNHRLLLQAFSDFYKNHRDYKLVLYGKGELQEELQELAEREGIREVVVFAGFVPDAPERIRKAAAYVLSSDYEGISNSLMEAMAVGMPVVSTDCPIGGSALLISHEVNGLLVPTGDRQALAAAMSRMADNREEAAKMAQRASCVREEYSAEKICGRWLEYMKQYDNGNKT